MTQSIKSRNDEIRSLYLKMKSKNKWTNDRLIAILWRIFKKWNISESTIRDIVGRR